jgi:type II secretory pathway pseudopilin PulG
MRKDRINPGKDSGPKTMQAIYAAARNEEGSFVIFSTLMILLLLTLTGIAATRTANTEVSIAGNEASRNISAYRAEGGAVEVAMRIEAADDGDLKVTDPSINPNYPGWMTFHSDINPGDMAVSANWDFSGDADDNAAVSSFNTDVQFAAVDKGVAAGSSLIMTGGEQKREYQVYGLSDSRSGRAFIEMGYRKRLL